MRFDDDPLYHSLSVLRESALESGGLELIIALGWAVIRRGGELIDEQCQQAQKPLPKDHP